MMTKPCLYFVIFVLYYVVDFVTSSSSSSSSPSYFSVKVPGRPYESSWDDDDEQTTTSDSTENYLAGRLLRKGHGSFSWLGHGREFDIFGSRGVSSRGGTSASSSSSNIINGTAGTASEGVMFDFPEGRTSSSSSATSQSANVFNSRKYRRPPFQYTSSPGGKFYYNPSSSSSSSSSPSSSSANNGSSSRIFQTVQDWWTARISPSIKTWPKIQCRVEPSTTLKIRKTIRPLKTIVRVGADFNTQLGVWQFKSSWEDAIIGGKLTLAGRELQLSKSWQLSVGAVEDLVTRLRFRAAIDLQTWKAYARVGFRTERMSPINVMEGFTLMKRVPLDGTKGHVKLEVKANFALPEPEIEYSTETQRSLVGMGDIEVSIDELNLVLDY